MKTTREIKFRGKRLDNGEWVYGSLVEYADGSCVIFPKEALFGQARASEGHAVDPETVGQFTNLPDRNGEEIYEGDIVEYIGIEDGKEYWCSGEVFFNDAYAGFRIRDFQYMPIPLKSFTKVIGNIYENPELLTKTQDEN